MPLERTESQRAASRANGAKSHGPTSVMGKLISSRNSLKHGLLADILLLPGEDHASFLALSTDIYDVYRPRNDVEDLYVQRMVDAEWHIRRVRDYEQAALMVEISAQGPDPEILIDGETWTHKGARPAAAFQTLVSTR